MARRTDEVLNVLLLGPDAGIRDRYQNAQAEQREGAKTGRGESPH